MSKLTGAACQSSTSTASLILPQTESEHSTCNTIAGNIQAENICMQQSMTLCHTGTRPYCASAVSKAGRSREVDLNRRGLSVGGFQDSGTPPSPISTPHYEVPVLMAPVTKAGWPCACKRRLLLASSRACTLSNELFVYGKLSQLLVERLRHMLAKCRHLSAGMRTL